MSSSQGQGLSFTPGPETTTQQGALLNQMLGAPTGTLREAVLPTGS